jgi:hypothetical protein
MVKSRHTVQAERQISADSGSCYCDPLNNETQHQFGANMPSRLPPIRLFFMSLVVVCAGVGASIAAEAPDETTLKPTGSGWTPLFEGKSLAGWKFEPDYWKLEDGLLSGKTPGTPEHHYAYTEKDYADYELHADVKLVGNNSGVCIRIAPTNFDNVPGYQVDMGDDYWGCLWDERGRGMVAKFPRAEADKLVNKEDWNHYYVKAQGHHIQVWLNGVKTVDVEDEKGRATGRIGFQLCHGGKKTEATFKNVVIKTLGSKADAKN